MKTYSVSEAKKKNSIISEEDFNTEYQESINTIIGQSYPKPIVIHEQARAAALKAFQTLKN